MTAAHRSRTTECRTRASCAACSGSSRGPGRCAPSTAIRYGVDADSAGGGPSVAIDDLDEALATMDADELFLVLDRHHLVGSVRAEPAQPRRDF